MFNTNNGGYSLSDIAAVTGTGRGNSENGWGDGDNMWWIILLFLFAGGGWGNGGFGGNGGSQGATTREEVAYGFDINGLERGITGVQQGLCDGFYAMNTSMLNGFSGVQSTLCQGFAGVNASVNGVNTAINAAQTALTAQLSNMAADQALCCCNTGRTIERGFADLGYALATQACDTRQAISNSTRDLLENQNSNTRAILDFLTQDKIATLTAENQGLRLAASQQAQNNYLISELKQCPVPAYVVPNPYCCNGYGGYNTCG